MSARAPMHPIVALVAIVVLLCLPVAGQPQPTPEEQELTQELLELARTWLVTSCGTGEAVGLPPRLIEQASAPVEAFFTSALQSGPSQELREEVGDRAADRFRARAALLDGEPSIGLTEQELADARNDSLEAFVSRAQADFDLRYRSQATVALGSLGGDEARSVLEPLARDSDSPLATSAQRALAEIEQRNG